MTVDKTFVTKASRISSASGLWSTQTARAWAGWPPKSPSSLRGKHKPIFTPGLDTGDFVVVVNASKVTVTGNKLTEKFYYRYSGYPGGLTSISLRDQISRYPDRVIEHAVWGMLPHNKLGRSLLKKLKSTAAPNTRMARRTTTGSEVSTGAEKVMSFNIFEGIGRRKDKHRPRAHHERFRARRSVN